MICLSITHIYRGGVAKYPQFGFWGN